MKTLIACLLLTSFVSADAQNYYEYIASPVQPIMDPTYTVVPPIAGQNFFLWQRHSGCGVTNYIVEPEELVVVEDNDVRVFF